MAHPQSSGLGDGASQSACSLNTSASPRTVHSSLSAQWRLLTVNRGPPRGVADSDQMRRAGYSKHPAVQSLT